MAIAGRPAVDAAAAGEQPAAGNDGSLRIDPADQGAAAGDAIAGEGAVHEAEVLTILSVAAADIAAGLPDQRSDGSAQSGVEAPAGGGGRVLVIGRRRGDPSGGHGDRAVLQVAGADPPLQPPAERARLRRRCVGDADGIPAGRGLGADEARAPLLLKERGADGDQAASGRRLHPAGDAPVVEAEIVVGRALALAHRNPAVVVFDRCAAEHLRSPGSRDAGDGASAPSLCRDRGVGLHGSGTGQLVQRDHAGQGPGAIGPGPRPPHHRGALDRLGRQRGPDHPAAERIVLRHAVQRHQGPSGARRRERAQRQALRGRVRRRAGGAPEQGHAGDLAQRLVQPDARVDAALVEADDGIGGVAGRRRQARGRHRHRLFGRGRRVGDGGGR